MLKDFQGTASRGQLVSGDVLELYLSMQHRSQKSSQACTAHAAMWDAAHQDAFPPSLPPCLPPSSPPAPLPSSHALFVVFSLSLSLWFSLFLSFSISIFFSFAPGPVNEVPPRGPDAGRSFSRQASTQRFQVPPQEVLLVGSQKPVIQVLEAQKPCYIGSWGQDV